MGKTIIFAKNKLRKIMKTTRFFLIGAMAVLLSVFASCGKDGGHPKNFPEGCPNFTKHAYAGDLVDAMAPGIYEFILSETFGKTAVLAKSTDGGVFWLEDIDYIAPDHTNIIGSAIYYGFYATDNKTSAFSLFGETIDGYGKAQYYTQNEFLDRTALYKGISNAAGEGGDLPYNLALKASEGILNTVMVMSHRAYNYDTFLDEWGQVYDTTICGIPVTHYSNEGHHFYVDEHWQCLYYVNHHMLNSVTGTVEHQLMHYYPAGTFEETYAKIYELYGPSLPKPEWNTCIKGYRKQADEWLTDEYPRSLDGWLKVYHGQGTIHDMEIGRRFTWGAHDHVCGITIKIENVPFADAMVYKNEAAGVCNEIYEDDSDANQGILHFKGEYDPEDPPVGFGEPYYHPGYEIELNKEGTLVIDFEVIKTIVVK